MDTLTNVGRCPICGSHERVENVSPMMDVKSRGHYVRWLMELIGDCADEWVAQIREFECQACRTIYRDPYFSSEVLSRFYATAAPHHKAGWKNFFDIALGERSDNPYAPEAVVREIERNLPNEFMYFEIGCPFMGALVSSLTIAGTRARLRSLLAESGRKPYLPRIAGQWSVVASGASAVLARNLWRPSKPEPANAPLRVVGDQSVDRYLVVDDSSQRWGVACSAFGASCWHVASSVGLGTVLGMAEYRALLQRRSRPAVVAYFDSLDHCGEPHAHLELAFASAQVVIIGSHSPRSAALQHRFAVTSRTMSTLHKRFSDFQLIDLSSNGATEFDGEHLWSVFVRSS